MEENKKYSKARKITGIVLSTVLFTGAFIGAGFGFAKSVEDVAGIDNNYNDFVQIEANVEDGKAKEASASIKSTLDFLGMQNANVRVIGDSKVVVNNPISAYTYFETNIMNDDKIHFEDIMSYSSNSNYWKEVGTLVIPLFFDGTLDIRDIEGDAAFVNDAADTFQNDWRFVGGVENGGSFGVEAEPEDPEGETYSSVIDAENHMVNFFDGAELKHEQGLPYIELKISKEGNNGDGYINMFKDLDRYIDSTASSENPTQYVFWFNYDLTYDLIEKVDPEGLASSSLYEYVASKPSLRPLYVATNSQSIMSSKYSDVVEVRGTFTEKQAKYFVDKINNSNNYSYSNIRFEVIINLQTKVMLLVLAISLLVIIIAVIFSFVAYFGLLGLIASAVYVVSSMTLTLIISGTGILITGLGLISLGFVFIASAGMIFIVLNEYKKNNEDKFISINKTASNKFSKIQSMLFSPIVVSILLFYFAGLALSTVIAIPLYMIVIGIVISYLFSALLLFGLVYLIDLLTEWTKEEYTSKWDIFIGFNKEYNKENNDKEIEMKRTLTGTIIASVLMGLSIIMGGTLYFTTGSAFNTNTYGSENYSYVVEAANEPAWMRITDQYTDTTGSAYPVNRFAADMVYTHYQSTNEVKDDVENAFSSNGVKVSSIETIRVDRVDGLGDIDGELQLLGSFGFEIYSRTAIDTTTAQLINEDLNAISLRLNDEISGYDAVTSFELSERMSWDGSESQKLNGYKENAIFISGLKGMAIMIFIISIIIMFISNIGVGAATFFSSIMEGALVVAPIVILYLPISTLSVFVVMLMFGISLILKALITKEAMSDEIEANKWQRATRSKRFLLPILAGVLFVMELFLIGIYSWTIVVPMLLITLVAPIGIYIIQQFVFPVLAYNFEIRRKEAVKNQLQLDIQNSKDRVDGEPREEYIEGVNM